SEGRLYVNNRLTPIKGMLWEEDHAAFGSSPIYEVLERDVASIKSLGANLVRFRHPPHPYLLNLCDRYGLMVMEEIPLVNVPGEILSRESYQELAAVAAREMIARDRNHACIL